MEVYVYESEEEHFVILEWQDDTPDEVKRKVATFSNVVVKVKQVFKGKLLGSEIKEMEKQR